MEILLQFEESRKELSVTCENACSLIKGSLQFDSDSVLLPFDKKTSGSCFILQKYSTKWSKYVDLKSSADIQNGDQLQVVSTPVSFPAGGRSKGRVHGGPIVLRSHTLIKGWSLPYMQ